MRRSISTIIAGALFGLFIGSSMGLAFGGSAYNAAWFFTPLGAFIGWLVHKSSASEGVDLEQTRDFDALDSSAEKVGKASANIFTSLLKILASLWNFQIDLLDTLGLLQTFVKQPLLFAGLCVVISVFFPPFLVIYFLSWLGASHFGATENTKYRAKNA
ncbi:hypothetical protein K3729_16720 [Rhodobacteraceae bacterium S2214]|nr:hypothetical protein K3729_16720 [Rhodobacteraceae bacterium S2214]